MHHEVAAAPSIFQGNKEFALSLYNHLARAGEENLFFSPYSISSALAMTFAGARGRTEQEMASVLRFSDEQDDLHPVFVKLNETIFGGQKPDYTIKIANRLCGQHRSQLRQEFLELLRKSYGVDLEQLIHKKYLSIKETCAYIGISRSTLYRHVTYGNIERIGIAGKEQAYS